MTNAPAAIEFMLQRVGGLLVSEELRPGAEGPSGVELGLREAGSGAGKIALLPILAALNSLRMGAILAEFLLPPIDQRIHRVMRRSRVVNDHDDPQTGRWLRWTPYERRALAIVLYEFYEQLRSLERALEQMAPGRVLPAVLLLIPSLIALRERIARTWDSFDSIDDRATDVNDEVAPALQMFADCLAATLSDPGICRAAWLNPYHEATSRLIDGGKVKSALMHSLVDWRSRHLQMSTGLGPGRHLPVQALPTHAELYDLWCFLELGSALSVQALCSQWTILRAFRDNPQEQSEISRYRSYLGRKFDVPHVDAPLNALIPHFLLIRSLAGSQTRVVVNTKYGPWSTQDAMAAMGWRGNAGVDHVIGLFSQPAVIWPYRQQPSPEGVVICPWGDGRSGSIAAAALIPAPEQVARNDRVLRSLIASIFQPQEDLLPA